MANITKKLLAWYAKNGRILPWRVSSKDAGSGRTPNPYKVWISEIMLQQTTVSTVIPYFEKFVEKWDCINALSQLMKRYFSLGWSWLLCTRKKSAECAKDLNERFNGKYQMTKNFWVYQVLVSISFPR